MNAGQGVIYRASGYTPARVSNHATEFAFQDYSRTNPISDAISYAFQDQGHNFYHLYFPAANKSCATTQLQTCGMKSDSGMSPNGFLKRIIPRSIPSISGNTWSATGKAKKIYDMEIPKWNGSTWDFATDNGH